MQGEGKTKKWLTLRNLGVIAVVGAVLGLGVFWIVTIPATVPASALEPYTPNLANGKTMFDIGGCPACHAVPNSDAEKIDRALGGGLALGFAVRHVLRAEHFARPEGRHRQLERGEFRHGLVGRHDAGRPSPVSGIPVRLLSAHGAQRRARSVCLHQDAAAGGRQGARPRLAFPFSIRRMVGGWKLLFLKGRTLQIGPDEVGAMDRGAYLVNGRGTARNVTARAIFSRHCRKRALRRRPGAGRQGLGANITPVGLTHWSKENITWSQQGHREFLEDGGRSIRRLCRRRDGEVVRNTSLITRKTVPRSPNTSSRCRRGRAPNRRRGKKISRREELDEGDTASLPSPEGAGW